MTTPPPATLPAFVADLASQLRQRGMALTPDDLAFLRAALRAGFGWASLADLERVCVCLWAKSAQEASVISAVFERADPDVVPRLGTADTAEDEDAGAPETREVVGAADAAAREAPATRRLTGLPPIPPPPIGVVDRKLLLTPQYPLGERTVAQAWRRVRRPVRAGPPTELDVAATVELRGRTGVASPPVLVPRRRNTARLLLLIDAGGSMRPYEDYVEHVCAAIRRAGRLDRLDVYYFHNAVAESDDRLLLDELPEPFGVRLDAILPRIRPLADGRLFTSRRMTGSEPFAEVLDGLAPHTVAAVISDAGAARGSFDAGRLVDSVALAKALKARCGLPAWLNPTPPARWARSTADQLRRHVPMSTLADKHGLDLAIEVLRVRPAHLERPL